MKVAPTPGWTFFVSAALTFFALFAILVAPAAAYEVGLDLPYEGPGLVLFVSLATTVVGIVLLTDRQARPLGAGLLAGTAAAFGGLVLLVFAVVLPALS